MNSEFNFRRSQNECLYDVFWWLYNLGCTIYVFMYANYPEHSSISCVFVFFLLCWGWPLFFPHTVFHKRVIVGRWKICSKASVETFGKIGCFSWSLAKLSGEVGKNTNCSSLAVWRCFFLQIGMNKTEFGRKAFSWLKSSFCLCG